MTKESFQLKAQEAMKRQSVVAEIRRQHGGDRLAGLVRDLVRQLNGDIVYNVPMLSFTHLALLRDVELAAQTAIEEPA